MAMKSSSLCNPFVSLFFFLLRKLAGHRYHRGRMAVPTKPSPPPPPLPTLDMLHGQTLVVDVEAWILRPPVSAFPYFMLVAVEAGGFLRGLLLLLLYPLMLLLLGDGARAKAMATVALVGLEEKEVARVGRAVLPKFFLEATAAEGVAAVQAAARVVAVTATFPRVMVDGFLREYVGVDAVVGPEVRSVGGVLAGLMDDEDADEVAAKTLRAVFGDDLEAARKKGAVGLVGPASSGRVHYLLCPYYCKETFAVSETDTRGWRPLPRDKYPRPLVFHDGRLAFAPTPPAALAMYTFLPFGIVLVVFRIIAFSFLPYRVCFPVGALTGVHYRLVAGHEPTATRQGGGGRLYVCNHRTLLDPVIVAAALGKPVTAVTYSLSPVSELIAPIRTARLTRDREKDQRNMAAVLARGDLVVCPEGTTCREEYLLRLSPLFAELGVDVNPVALDTRVGMFYGTSTKPGRKWMDPFYFMMNPRPAYRVEFLPRAATAPVDNGGRGHSIDVANRVQRELGKALGFELTGLTRKDKYLTLAGNEGVVPTAPKNH
ncbi:glycerol-3-phosphate acyltransferase 1 precursor [Zea mays]|uniref:Glycerol-3-phosphate acyltransferase 1 n=1 Tax=Zea mays TaxID=4577 RepID=A0A1D6MPJ5_MAIZE|nr:glycerol-3-phosphate acyltransferase 1 precursor [Zea mays]ONM30970.1 Glycerol-3-phosphate acyltransferase 1 [Zea mays]